MLKYSSFVKKTDYNGIVKETKFNIVFAAVLFLTGLLFILIPIVSLSDVMMLAASWILIITIGLTVMRPLLYCRGLADITTGIIAVLLYFVLELSFGYSVKAIENLKLLLSFILFMLGISRIISFAQLINKVKFPILIVSGAAEMGAAAVIFSQWPVGNYGIIYWAIGMTIIISAFESLQEALRLKTGA